MEILSCLAMAWATRLIIISFEESVAILNITLQFKFAKIYKKET
jgi:hypothetical protein